MSKVINKVNSDIYIGKSAGTMILDDMISAKRSIKVMSPYLSAVMVDVLMDRSHAGVQIELVTSDEVEDHKHVADKNAYKIIKQHTHIDERLKSRKTVLFWLGLGLMGFFGLLSVIKLIDLFSPMMTTDDLIQLLVLAAVVLVGSFIWKQSNNIVFYRYSYSSRFPIKIFYSYFNRRKVVDKSKAFTLHSKLYIIDDEIAYLGSINFTTSGHQFNHETRIRTTDPEAIRQLKEEFNELLHNDFYNAKTIHEWGMELYEGEGGLIC